ncbi:MAG: hypothetical protein ACK4FE_11175 [Azonexus sp.]
MSSSGGPPAASGQPVDAQGEVDALLPADIEREFRLLLARRLRHSGSLGSAGGTGTVTLSVVWRGTAGGAEVSLMQSSGDAALDAHALSSLARVLPDVALPQALRGRRFRMALVLEYGPEA